MNNGSIGSRSQVSDTFSFSSSYQRSLSGFQAILSPVLFIIKVFFIFGQFWTASSTFFLRGIFLPPLIPISAVITSSQFASKILSFKDSDENPPNTTEWIDPILVQASIAKAASGIMGIYKHTFEPLEIPIDFKTLENLHTSIWSSRKVNFFDSFGSSPSQIRAIFSAESSRCLSIQFRLIFVFPPSNH